ncbi:MAG TPA: phosphatidylglycerophosphatase A [Fimbriimonadaceae bacterium]|nr:phosphatidylglycerophosphatase A [Fimbriimonadaceae bacterium]
MSFLARLIATWFYLGYFPKGPGTAGSIGALLVALPIAAATGWNPRVFFLVALIGLAPAIWAADRMARDTGSKDPQTVVVDEVIGQWIALAGCPAFDHWSGWVAAFGLFRFFDIVKPPPVRALEKLPGGTGIVMDDVMAGVYAALVLAAAGWFNR